KPERAASLQQHSRDRWFLHRHGETYRSELPETTGLSRWHVVFPRSPTTWPGAVSETRCRSRRPNGRLSCCLPATWLLRDPPGEPSHLPRLRTKYQSPCWRQDSSDRSSAETDVPRGTPSPKGRPQASLRGV